MNCANSSEFIDDELGDFLVTPVKRKSDDGAKVVLMVKESETSSQSEVVNLS